nr:cell division protein ZipA [uncultured Halomonas sp.]
MELREWLIILGLVLVTIIVVDGVRRLQRQRKVPRLDHAQRDEQQGDSSADSATVANPDPEAAAREAEVNWELPNGGARVVKPAAQPTVAPKPKLQRQEHPGPSKVFSRMAQEQDSPSATESPASVKTSSIKNESYPQSTPSSRTGRTDVSDSAPTISSSAGRNSAGFEPSVDNAAHPLSKDHDDAQRRPQTTSNSSAYETFSPVREEAEQHSASRGGMAAALRSGGQRVSQSMQRMSSAFQRQDESSSSHREPSLGNAEDFSTEAPEHFAKERQDSAPSTQDTDHHGTTSEPVADELAPTQAVEAPPEAAAPFSSQEEEPAASHPVVEKARRHHVSAERARETLAHAEEIIVISVMARTDEGFAGPNLLKLMLACGLRYSEMGIFLRYETEEAESELQFAMVDVVKPGIFDLENMDDFATPGVTFLMPLPGATDTSAAFEAMVETAMVLVRNLGGELKDENRSVMTAQTVEFARQRVQEFGRRHRLSRYQAN